MKCFVVYSLVVCAFLFFFTACVSQSARTISKTTIQRARTEIPEEQLLDVGITIFENSEITDKQAKKEGTNPDVRNAENNYIPYHLKNTLEQSSHWGMVWVLPVASDSADVLVHGKILESNGENLTLMITVSDASGNRWFKKKYKANIDAKAYANNRIGLKDPYQGLYNAIANDIAAFKTDLSFNEIRDIRAISKLKLAKDLAPDAFENHLSEDKNGRVALNRLPSDHDPMMERVMSIRERDYMFIDTLNEYYEGFYNEMWTPYTQWRELNLTERTALAEQKNQALMRKIGGALLIALAIGLEFSDKVNSSILSGGLVIVGGKVFISGVNISKQADMHYEALAELGESFGGEMKPVIVELEGKKYELSGTAEQQYKRWRELLREIYYVETGFEPSQTSSSEEQEEL